MSLRSKLLLAFVLPLIALIALTTLRVQSRLDEARTAETQLAEVNRALTLSELAIAVRNERDVIASLTTNESDVLASQEATDRAFTQALDGSLGSLTGAQSEAVRELQERVRSLRAILPTNPSTVRLMVGDELAAGTQLTDEGTVVWAFSSYSPAVSAANDLTRFDPRLIVDGGEAANLTTLQLITRTGEAIRNETLFYIQVSQLPGERITPATLGVLQRQFGSSQAYEAALRSVASPTWQNDINSFFASDAHLELEAKREAIPQFVPGEVIPIDPIEVAGIQANVLPPLDDLQAQILAETRASSTEIQETANRNAVLTLGTLAGLGIALALVMFALYRSIRKPILRLTKRANEIASTELPAAVDAMRHDGDNPVVTEVEPIRADTNDEVGDLVHAFNGMHVTALDLATQQAASRRIVGDMFVNLGRRNQKLLIRILKTMDRLEENETDPQRLADLYKVDHLATRMRRNAESLLVLAGAQTSRRFSRPATMGDVVRAALTEVEHYERVDVSVNDSVELVPEAVADVGHLIAELIENALTFSPQDRNVNVLARDSRNGYLIAVIDQGFGLSKEDLAEYNKRIKQAAVLEETPSKFLGLHVVGRLAARHGVVVELMEGVTSGVTARVRIPQNLIVVPKAAPAPLIDLDALDRAAPVAPPQPVPHQSTTQINAPTALETAGSPLVRRDVEAAVPQHRPRTTVLGSAAPGATPVSSESSAPPTRQTVTHDSGLPQRRATDATRSASGEPSAEPSTLFGAVRRTPGESLPAAVQRRSAPPAARTANDAPGVPPEEQARAVRDSLSGFQRAVRRADDPRRPKPANHEPANHEGDAT